MLLEGRVEDRKFLGRLQDPHVGGAEIVPIAANGLLPFNDGLNDLPLTSLNRGSGAVRGGVEVMHKVAQVGWELNPDGVVEKNDVGGFQQRPPFGCAC